MSKNRTHSIERIGRSIYPLRVFGFILFAISIYLSQSRLGASLDGWSIASILICLTYPHLAFLRYLKNEARETEIMHMRIDMGLQGAMLSCLSFTPAVFLPYLIANSAANYALRGMKQVVQGLALAFICVMIVGLLRDQHIILDADPIEFPGPFIYLTIVTHYMGHLAYARGMSLIRRKQEAEETARLDFLTGLNNRRFMFDQIRLNDQSQETHDIATTLILADLDHFKQINDTYGHDHGDAVLIQVSGLIKSSLRGTDIVARWGGEEFLVLLPKTDIRQGTSVAETIRETIANKPIIYGGVEHHVTLTLGVASYNTHSNFEDTIQRADKALYKGKELGRNQVIRADGE